MYISVLYGDIARIPSQALITAINSEEWNWTGAIDFVIQRAAGAHFHS